MGNSESVDIPGGGSDGYHIFRVQPNSPGSKAGLQPFFDIIVAINGVRLNKDDGTLKNILKTSIGKPIPITIYSSKTQSIRSVTVEPSDSWGGQGLLGISIRFCSFDLAKDNVWHILEIHPNSPAELAGLKPFSDYIIGADSIMHESDDLYNLIENHDGSSLKLYVYNCDLDSCRDVTITPNSRWGGEGLLGCGIGYGYLHRIPIRAHPPEQGSQTFYNPNDSAVDITVSQASTTINPPSSVINLNKTAEKASVSGPTVVVPAGNTIKIEDKAIEDIRLQTQNISIKPTATVQGNLDNQNQIPAQNGNPEPINIPTSVAPPISLPSFSTSNFSAVPSMAQTNSSIHLPIQTPMSQVQTIPQIPMYNPAQYTSAPVNPPLFNYPQAASTNPLVYAQGETVNLSYPPSNFPATTPTIPQNYQAQTAQLIYDPTIAAKSAQQLLSRNLDSFGNISQNT
ncbi:Golgi reassembly-stacking protein 2 isoform X2 [Rhynchophorus ferrugineus]|uniref:Golgi reassembly-stacking protein 2 isoform X2 n=1 Tax=Rhynchophorus ferrugineus TaxID=354439 RepID=UPI003FCE7B03